MPLIAYDNRTLGNPPGPPAIYQGIGIISATLPVNTLDVDVYLRVIADVISASAFPITGDFWCYRVVWALVLNEYENDLSLRKMFAGFPPSYNFGRVSYGYDIGVSAEMLWNYEQQVFPAATFTISNLFGKKSAQIPVVLPPPVVGQVYVVESPRTSICVADTCRVLGFGNPNFRYAINYTIQNVVFSTVSSPAFAGLSII